MSLNSRDGPVVVRNRYRYHYVCTKAPEVGMTEHSAQGHVSLGSDLTFPFTDHIPRSYNHHVISPRFVND